MDIFLKETPSIELTSQRKNWSNDPLIAKYLGGKSGRQTADAFSRYYEIYVKNKLVGDIKVFGDTMDVLRKKAQILIVLGEERGKGIGTQALRQLLTKIQSAYQTVYCHVNRYNIASIKMLQKNGFRFNDLQGNEFILTRSFQ